MNAKSKKHKLEWDFFINPVTGKISYNEQCASCKNDCKQSYRTSIVCCHFYEKKEENINA